MSEQSQNQTHSQNIEQVNSNYQNLQGYFETVVDIKKEQFDQDELIERQFNVLDLNDSSIQNKSSRSEPAVIKIENKNNQLVNNKEMNQSENTQNRIDGECEQIIIQCGSSNIGQKELDKQHNLLSEQEMECIQINVSNNQNEQQQRHQSNEGKYEITEQQKLQQFEFKMDSLLMQCDNSAEQQQQLSILQCPLITKTKSEPICQTQQIIQLPTKSDSSNVNVEITQNEQYFENINNSQNEKENKKQNKTEQEDIKKSNKTALTLTILMIVLMATFSFLLITATISFKSVKESIQNMTLITFGLLLVTLLIVDRIMRNKNKIQQSDNIISKVK